MLGLERIFARKADLFDVLYRSGPSESATAPIRAVALPPAAPQHHWQTGDKWAGGFGTTKLYEPDYWTLRARSSQLFETNGYCRGIIRRLVTNEINTGLHLEATPEESILGVEEDSLSDWAEDVENRFGLWGKDPYLCDHVERETFGAIQAQARLEALVAGDVLVVLRQLQTTRLPRIQLINGASVQTPMNAKPARGNKIKHGVECDQFGRHVAYWIRQEDNSSKRLPAYGEKSGRRLAWLLYGTDKRLDDVRGKPMPSMFLQALAEIDRYRDAVQRKALVNSMLALFIKKSEDKIGTKPFTGGAHRRGVESTVDGKGVKRTFNVAEHMPGAVLDELQVGEEPVAFPSHGTDEKFAEFEAAMIGGIAWMTEIPPEILTLAFSNNYSASQAAINEFKMYLDRARMRFGDEFCQPIYVEWLVAQALAGKVSAAGLLESWRDPVQYDTFGAWTSSDWTGHVKPSTDVFKQAKGIELLLSMGLGTRDRFAREATGTKFSKNVKKLRRENEQLAEALEPLVELEKPEPPPLPPGSEGPPGEGSAEDEDEKETEE
jgi:capsid protein